MTRTRSHGKLYNKGPQEITLSVCRPNYLERKYLKNAKPEFGWTFPIDKPVIGYAKATA